MTPEPNPIKLTGALFVDRPLRLASGAELEGLSIAYEIYGQISPTGNNVVLIAHALTGDQFVASVNPLTRRPAWWATMVGPGLSIDTNRYCVVCTNVIGGCMGTTGPSSAKDSSGTPWGIDFPLITITDMVAAQRAFMDYIGIDRFCAIVGGSMGGMQVLEWLRLFPRHSERFVILASSYRQNVQNLAFHEAGRQAIMGDPEWDGGRYLLSGRFPEKGLSIARMIAHITYVAPEMLGSKFGRSLQRTDGKTFRFEAEFRIQNYLEYQGRSFISRFDPNSYLYLTKAMDYFDQSENHGGDLVDAYSEIEGLDSARVCLVAFSSDWMFPPSETTLIQEAIVANGGNSIQRVLASPYGHDSFLVEDSQLEEIVSAFLNET